MLRTKGHIRQLDGIRGLAILLVALSHYAEGMNASAAARVLQSGWIGVDLFFVLSGYLITGILLDSRESASYFRNFYARRVLRIAPVYYAALALYFGVLQRFDGMPHTHPLWFLLYGTNVLVAASGWPTQWLGHFWSLAVEEQFYLVWPWLVRGFPARVMFRICFGLWLCSAAARFWMRFAYGTGADVLYVLTPYHLDGLAAGGALASVVRWRAEEGAIRRWSLAALVAGLAGMLAVAVQARGAFGYGRGMSPLGQALGYVLLAAAFAGLIGMVLTAGEKRAWSVIFGNGLLVRFGKYSYAIYVFHPWMDTLARSAGLHPVTLPGVVVYSTVQPALALGIGAASWNLMEKHFLKLKSHFEEPAKDGKGVLSAAGG